MRSPMRTQWRMPGEILPLPFLRYRRVKIQGRGRVGDRSTVPLLLKLYEFC
jgi:hypothetical protein